MENKNEKATYGYLGLLTNILFNMVFLAIGIVVFSIIFMYVDLAEFEPDLYTSEDRSYKNNTHEESVATPSDVWIAPNLSTISDDYERWETEYGKELIAHTSRYLGPKGTKGQISNGMNCQNCHLDAGTRTWGNNYGSVYANYPKFRARSGTEENIYKRVNDCFQRSLNGMPLDTASREMQAIKKYIEYIGSNVQKGAKAEGSGLKDLAFMTRASDPEKGKKVYIEKCQSCHLENGEGVLTNDGKEYVYPPLWGKNSYNDGAGLYRNSFFAKFVKYNMPFGATYQNVQLTDEEAWDVAAFVNSQPRPHINVPLDWPDITKKPPDHPFEPYADTFNVSQHKFGPWQPIVAFYKNKDKNKQ